VHRPPALFALVIFEVGSHYMPKLAWTEILLQSWGDKCAPQPAFFTGRDEGLTFPSWPGTTILLISTSQIAGYRHEAHAELF
jgi:hypothetical protein